MNRLTALFFALCASPAFAQMDKIHLKGGNVIEGEVVDMSCTEIRFLTGGNETVQPAKDVREIEFDPSNKTFDYSDGESKFRAGDFAEARDKFQKSLRDPRASKPIKQVARFMIVQCTLELGEHDNAIRDSKQLRSEMPDTFYLKDLFVVHYNAARAKGGAGEAETALKDLEAAAGAKSRDDWRKSAELLRADLLESKPDYRGAKSIYDRYISDRDAQVQLDARLGVMRCLGGLQDWGALAGRADQYINEWRGKPDPPYKLLMGASLGKGKALLYGDKKNKDALLELMRCHLDLSPKIGGESCVEHEEALAHGAIAAARYGAESKGAEEKDKQKRDTYRQRALQLKDELNRKYGKRFNAAIDKEIQAIPK